MNLQQLEHFITISRLKNFTKAATSLSITQPALSKSISKLENELNVDLFQKNRRSIELTSYGEIFLKYATSALSEIEKGIKEIKSISSVDTKVVSISSTYSIGTYFMPYLISNFLNKHPDVKFQFNHQSNTSIIEQLKQNNLELGFFDKLYYVKEASDLEYIPVRKEEYVLIVPKNHRLSKESEVSLRDLKNELFVAFCEEDMEKFVSHYSHFIGFVPKISIQPNDASMIEGLVAAGAGISIIPNTPNINTNQLSILKIKEDISDRIVYMGWLKNNSLSKTANLFKKYVIKISNLNY